MSEWKNGEQDTLELLEQRVDSEHKVWYFRARGSIAHPIVREKLRVTAIFRCGQWERRFPLAAYCVTADKTYFQVSGRVELEYVFYHFDYGSAEHPVEVSFAYCDAEGSWHTLNSRKIALNGWYFLERQRKKRLSYEAYRVVAYLLCTMLLPVWLLDGYFVAKGYKKSSFVEGEVSGKRLILYHAHGLVMAITGYGYSLRESKTKYFSKCYNKACKRGKKPEGVLFLSERQPDAGGNLDVVRRVWLERGHTCREFIDEKPIHKLSLRAIRQTARLVADAEVIVLEDFYPQIHALKLRPETKLVQLWHACGAFKTFGLSEPGRLEKLGQDTSNHRSYSYAFVSSEKMVPFYSEAFGIAERQVLPMGVPRTDAFFKEGYREMVIAALQEKYPALKEKRVLLFAPTFRGDGKKTGYYPMECFDANAFIEGMPEDTVLVIKNHPFMNKRFTVSEENRKRVLDMTERENINDLLLFTDVLITDYSSVIFEAALLKVPMVFYVFDLEEYMASRNIYFDFESFAPGSRVKEFDKLLTAVRMILRGERKEEEERIGRFCDYFLDALDGKSTERVVEFLESLM